VVHECADLIRTHDWERTALGPREHWPSALRAMVSNMLHARQPMLLFWGPQQIQLYNDAFVPSFGRGKHPRSMGQPARECWAEVWPVVGAQLEAVTERGEPAWHEDALVPIERNGRMEEVFWTYSYSPAHDDDDRINGILVIVTEVTGRVLSRRRLAVLATLTMRLSAAMTHTDVLAALAAIPAQCPQDVPLLVLDATLPCEAPNPVWPEPTRKIVEHAIGTHRAAFGISPRLPYDAAYRSFVEQICEQASSALQRVDSATVIQAAQRERDDLLMQSPVAAALMLGPAHIYQLANRRYCEIVGRDPMGRPWREAFPELVEGPLPAVLDRVYATGEPFTVNEMVVPMARKGTEEIDHDAYFNFNLVAVRDHTGVVIGQMVVAVEVTEQVRARQVLQEANRSKDEFLAMLGHELRNPLAPIVSALDLMAAKDTAGVTARERTIVGRQLRHVVRLVDDLLDISRITRGAIALEQQVLDLGEAVRAAVESTKPVVHERGHRLEIDVPDGVNVFADPARIAQIVSNLMTNAAKYTPDGGEVRVTLVVNGGAAVLEVADTGVGIGPQLLPRVFDLFVQDPQSIERREGGLGLGLAIVKNLVALHGGSVEVHSAGPGQGSVFSIRLPLVAAMTAPTPPRPPLPIATGRQVLVVDDNVEAAELLGDLLRAHGHEVTVVHHPADALACAAEVSPQVALLDIGLPGMDGYELATRLGALVPACRLIALTGYGQDNDRARGIAAGFAAHLIKPTRIDDLLALISD
jgi:signal transduction histidine kinase